MSALQVWSQMTRTASWARKWCIVWREALLSGTHLVGMRFFVGPWSAVYKHLEDKSRCEVEDGVTTIVLSVPPPKLGGAGRWVGEKDGSLYLLNRFLYRRGFEFRWSWFEVRNLFNFILDAFSVLAFEGTGIVLNILERLLSRDPFVYQISEFFYTCYVFFVSII